MKNQNKYLYHHCIKCGMLWQTSANRTDWIIVLHGQKPACVPCFDEHLKPLKKREIKLVKLLYGY